MVCKHLYWLPIAVFVFMPGSFLICYLIAVAKNHVYTLFPYISEAGSVAPESCVFGLLLNISSALIAFCMYLRHRQIMEYYRFARATNRKKVILSRIFLVVGFLSAFGTTIVANFQVKYTFVMHMIGANMAFTLGLLYMWAQSPYSYFMAQAASNRFIAHTRVVICVFTTIFYFSTYACGGLVDYPERELEFYESLGRGSVRNEESNDTEPVRMTMTPVLLPMGVHEKDPGYELHLCSRFSEWLLVLGFVSYFLTFAFELRKAVIIPIRLVIPIDESMRPRDDELAKERTAGENGGMARVSSIAGSQHPSVMTTSTTIPEELKNFTSNPTNGDEQERLIGAGDCPPRPIPSVVIESSFSRSYENAINACVEQNRL